MSESDRGKELLPIALKGPLDPGALRAYFQPRSDFTYRTLEDLVVSGVDLFQSLFTGSLTRNCTFENVRFSRSDLDGVRGEACSFVECDFSTCDLRSDHFVECTFENCLFRDTFINDCTFEKCRILACGFEHSSLVDNRFSGGLIERCQLAPGTFLHNKFVGMTISDMALGDCTILYIILRDCTLTNVKINAESLGAMLGLTAEDVENCELIHLGEEQPRPEGTRLIQLITEEYRNRQWHLGEMVLALNFGTQSTVGAISKYLSATAERFRAAGFAKGDEIRFLGDVLDELDRTDRLPLFAAIRVLEWCQDLDSVIPTPTDMRGTDALRTLAGRVALLIHSRVEELDTAFPELRGDTHDRRVLLEINFRQRPGRDTSALIDDIMSACLLNAPHRPYVVRSGTGSFFEVICATLLSAYAFQLFLYLVNGCLVEMTEMKERIRVLARTTSPKVYREIALTPAKRPSPVMATTITRLAKFAKGLNWLDEAALSGFSADNIQSLTMTEPEPLVHPIDGSNS